ANDIARLRAKEEMRCRRVGPKVVSGARPALRRCRGGPGGWSSPERHAWHHFCSLGIAQGLGLWCPGEWQAAKRVAQRSPERDSQHADRLCRQRAMARESNRRTLTSGRRGIDTRLPEGGK